MLFVVWLCVENIGATRTNRSLAVAIVAWFHNSLLRANKCKFIYFGLLFACIRPYMRGFILFHSFCVFVFPAEVRIHWIRICEYFSAPKMVWWHFTWLVAFMGSLMLLLLRLLKKMYDLIIMHFRKPSGHIVVHAHCTVYRLKMNERMRKKKNCCSTIYCVWMTWWLPQCCFIPFKRWMCECVKQLVLNVRIHRKANLAQNLTQNFIMHWFGKWHSTVEFDCSFMCAGAMHRSMI